MAKSVLTSEIPSIKSAVLYDHLLVMPADPLIDDPLDQPGDGKIHEDQRGQQGQGQGGALPIGPHKSGKFEYLVHLQIFRKSIHLKGRSFGLFHVYGEWSVEQIQV